MAETGKELAAEAAAAADPDADWFAAGVATFGDRLAGAREAAGLSQAGLAQRIGVQLTTLQAWEDDMAEPRGNRLQMLAGLLNVSLTWLLTAEGDGITAPDDPSQAAAVPAGQVRAALADLARLRNQASALVQELVTVEKRLEQALQQEQTDVAK
ncbi:helix-turn-helix domain-containing protein [Xinfangfangia sp. D13-10-4-6]|uniref:helix-turn-helix domain-containing protein n=1 Tax=Pseudogemmobacter hezensis TaxID=2737662 RepID=UPI001552386A|nr:helix-turn-helix domain-containing protein [Pseudogemmobacter hezensis]NPD13740.1 helix-turn-helix domain-containing protein [Pseudogemmobacter hezensis]